MERIRQHGASGELFDLKDIAPLLEPFGPFNEWQVHVEWCTGPASEALQELTAASPRISHEAFVGLSRAIHQTIDGNFVGYRDGKEIVRLAAVDSSWWEVSGPVALVGEMLARFGRYEV